MELLRLIGTILSTNLIIRKGGRNISVEYPKNFNFIFRQSHFFTNSPLIYYLLDLFSNLILFFFRLFLPTFRSIVIIGFVFPVSSFLFLTDFFSMYSPEVTKAFQQSN
jgi:hypothetical protein